MVVYTTPNIPYSISANQFVAEKRHKPDTFSKSKYPESKVFNNGVLSFVSNQNDVIL